MVSAFLKGMTASFGGLSWCRNEKPVRSESESTMSPRSLCNGSIPSALSTTSTVVSCPSDAVKADIGSDGFEVTESCAPVAVSSILSSRETNGWHSGVPRTQSVTQPMNEECWRYSTSSVLPNEGRPSGCGTHASMNQVDRRISVGVCATVDELDPSELCRRMARLCHSHRKRGQHVLAGNRLVLSRLQAA